MNMNNNLVKLNNISKTYYTKENEIEAISDISIDIPSNTIIAIVGPSGCGKSTLLNIIGSLEKLTSGKISFSNNDIKLGYMFQSDCLFPWLTILDNALIGLEVTNNKTKDNINKVINLLKKYGLYEFKDSYPNNLSGGMRQRVALIRTLAIKPDLILLDEPYSALDYQTRLALSNDMYQIMKNERKTAIMITHNISEAVSMADRVIVLSKRPCTIKKIYDIKLDKKSNPIENRKDKNFNYYYDMIWRDLDVHL